MIADRRGQGAVVGFLVMLIFILIAAVLLDVWTLYQTREFGYRVARHAALAGASEGRDWDSINADGIALDAAVAMQEAGALITLEMNARNVTGYASDVRVISGQTGGTITGYPPVTRATTFETADWSSPEPAVGVYLEIPVTPILLGILNGNAPVTLHIFAAAGVGNP